MKLIRYITAISLIALAACTSSEKQQIGDEVKAASEQIDHNLAPGVTLTGLDYDGNDIVCTMAVDNSAGVEYLRTHEDLLEQRIDEAFDKTPEIESALELLRSTGTSIKVIVKAPDGSSYDYTYTPRQATVNSEQ